MNQRTACCLLGLAISCLAVLAQGSLADEQPAPRLSAAPAHLANALEVRKQLGLTPEFDAVAGIDKLKIAVLDYGFEGIDGVHGYLPRNAVLVDRYDPEMIRKFDLGAPDFHKALAAGNRHGRLMAQMIWAITGSHPEGPQFYLLNANGPTMLRRAVRYAIEAGVDIILFSGIFEGGGNGDGHGPIDRIVADAVAANIIWINSSGNYGGCVYNGPVQPGPDSYLRFRDDADGAALRFRNRLDENTVTITLTWNDYRETEDAGTDKDLDLFIEDAQGHVLGASELRQVSGPATTKDQTRNPRERVILTELPANLDNNYRIRVRVHGGQFTAQDRLRVLVTATKDTYVNPTTRMPEEGVQFLDASNYGEIYPPADNPLVLTVGDASPTSSIGPTLDRRVKPDVILPEAQAFFTDGDISSGSSNAAAYFAGVVAVMKAAEPALNIRHLLQLAQSGGSKPAADTVRTTATVTRSRYPWYGEGRSSVSSERSSPSSAVQAISPRPGVVVLSTNRARYTPGRRYYFASDPTHRVYEMLPAPREVPARSEVTTSRVSIREWLIGQRTWQTPTRSQLAQVVRSTGG